MSDATPHRALLLSGRILLALLFAVSGLAKFASIGVTAGYVASEGLPLDTGAALAFGALEFVLGVLLGSGRWLRAVAFVMAAYTAVSALWLHPFWAVAPELQFAQQILFMKALGVAAGLLFIAGAGCERAPSVAARTMA